MTLIQRIRQANTNNAILFKNIFFSFAIKGGALIVSLLSTRFFIKYFNNNVVLGVWYTLLSVLLWVLNFDLGIGNGIRNSLVDAFYKNDNNKVKSILSSGIFIIFVVTICLTILGTILLLSFDLNEIFNIDNEIISSEILQKSTIIIFLAIMIRFFFSFVTSIFYALQKSAVNSCLAFCVSILQLLFVSIFHFENVETALVNLSIAYLFLSNFPVFIACIFLFIFKLKKCLPDVKYIKKEYIKGTLSIGGVFFVCQILYMLIVNTNEFLITNLFGPENTTEYTFYYKITSIIAMIATLALTPIWSLVTKAIAENNWLWIKKLYNKIKIIGFVIIILEFILVPFLQLIMNFWLKENTFSVSYITAISFACFGSVFVYSSMLSTIVCGMSRMKLQLFSYLFIVILKFGIIFILSKFTTDWSIVVWSNTILLLPYCVVQQIDLNVFINKQQNQKEIVNVG